MSDLDFVRSERSAALQKALSLPLPDAVYEVVRYNDTRSPSYMFVIDLSELMSRWSAAELEEWEMKSRRLRASAYPVGDAGLRRDGSYEEARAKFISNNPGFDDQSYEDAISLGYRQAR